MNAILAHRVPLPLQHLLVALRRWVVISRSVIRLSSHRFAIRALNFQPDGVAAPTSHEVLCRLEDLPDGGVIGVDPAHPVGLPLVLRRKGDEVHAWLNICPQDGRRMNWAPGLFHVKHSMLRCAVRDAVFALDRGGVCVSGPCRGRWLLRVPVQVQGGLVTLAMVRGPQSRRHSQGYAGRR